MSVGLDVSSTGYCRIIARVNFEPNAILLICCSSVHSRMATTETDKNEPLAKAAGGHSQNVGNTDSVVGFGLDRSVVKSRQNLFNSPVGCIYTLCLKKVPTFKLSLTLSNCNRFSKFLHYWKTYEICYKTYMTPPTSP